MTIKILGPEDFDKPEVTIAQMKEWYNENCNENEVIKGTPRNKKVLINQCKLLLKSLDDQIEFEEETADMTDEEFQASMMSQIDSATQAEAETQATAPVGKAVNHLANSERRLASNSIGISKSWEDARVKKARTTRNKVEVRWEHHTETKVEVFRSAGAAFSQLMLNDSKCIRFRMKLKASGCEVYEEDGIQYTFTIIANEE